MRTRVLLRLTMALLAVSAVAEQTAEVPWLGGGGSSAAFGVLTEAPKPAVPQPSPEFPILTEFQYFVLPLRQPNGQSKELTYRLQRKLGSGGMADAWLAYRVLDGKVREDLAPVVLRFPRNKQGVEFAIQQQEQANGLKKYWQPSAGEARWSDLYVAPWHSAVGRVSSFPPKGATQGKPVYASVMPYANGAGLYSREDYGDFFRVAGITRQELALPSEGERVDEVPAILNRWFAKLEQPFLSEKTPIAHRDIKPDNIFLTFPEKLAFSEQMRKSEPVYGDLEMAGAIGSRAPLELQPREKAGQIMGSLGYMPPEYLGRSPSKASHAGKDPFALGMTMLELMTGKNARDIHAGRGVGGFFEYAFAFRDYPAVQARVRKELDALEAIYEGRESDADFKLLRARIEASMLADPGERLAKLREIREQLRKGEWKLSPLSVEMAREAHAARCRRVAGDIATRIITRTP